MSDNRYAMPGWIAITAAILFPIGFFVGIIQSIIGAKAFGYHGPSVGPSDLIFLITTAMFVYVLYMLRNFLNERYDFHDVDSLITFTIWLNIIFQVCGLALKLITVVLGNQSEMLVVISFIVYMSLFMIIGGIIDILIAVKLLRVKDKFSDLVKAYAYITLVGGILGVSVILSPLAVLLVPVSMLIIGMIFLKEKEEVEFV